MPTKTIRKGLISPADVNWGTSTFSRATSTGGSQTLSKVPIFYVDANGTYTSIASAVSAIGSGASGLVYLPAGTHAPTAQIATGTKKVFFRGAGINQTIIQPTAALASTLFSMVGSGEGYGFEDLTIDMSNVGTIGAISMSGLTRPWMNNVRIIYPTGGTGTAIQGDTLAELHFGNLYITKPGTGVLIDGDAGLEHYWDNIVIEDAGTVGFKYTRTTATDIGAIYLKGVKVTNPGSRSGNQSFIFTSSASNCAMPVFMLNVVGDGALGGATFEADDINQWFLSNCWFTNAAAGGSNYAAAKLTNITEFFATTSLFHSASRDLQITTAGTSFMLIANKFSGSATNLYLDSTPTLSNVRLLGNVYSGTVTNDEATLAAGSNATAFSTGGMEVWTRSDTSGKDTLKLVNKTSGGSAVNKHLRVNGSGNLELVNSAFSTVIFSVTDAGEVEIEGALNHDGTTVGFYGTAPVTQAAASANLTGNAAGTANGSIQTLTDPGDSPASADALRDDLVANLIPELRNNIDELRVKVNDALAALRGVGLIAP